MALGHLLVAQAALEELAFDASGRLLSDTLSTYKLPDAHFMPRMRVELFEKPNPVAVANSKAVGEPPLMYGIAGYFAVLDALRAARPGAESFHDLPMTPEKAMRFLAGEGVAPADGTGRANGTEGTS